MKAFFAEHPVPDAERTLAQTVERISTCAAKAQSQRGHLEEWLSKTK